MEKKIKELEQTIKRKSFNSIEQIAERLQEIALSSNCKFVINIVKNEE